MPHPPSRSPLAGPFWPPDRSLRAGDPHLGKVTEVMPPTRRDRYFPAQDPSVGLRWPPLPTARSRPKWHESGTKVARSLPVLWRYAVRARLVRPDAVDEEIQTLTARLTPGLGDYMVLIVVGLFLPIVAIVGYLAIAVVRIVPFGLRKHRAAVR